jgi:hypothetical protein
MAIARRVFWSTPSISVYCSEGNCYDRKGRHKAQRDERRPQVTSLRDGGAEKYWQNRQCARSRNCHCTGERGNNNCQHRATPNMRFTLCGFGWSSSHKFERESGFVTTGMSGFREGSVERSCHRPIIDEVTGPAGQGESTETGGVGWPLLCHRIFLYAPLPVGPLPVVSLT